MMTRDQHAHVAHMPLILPCRCTESQYFFCIESNMRCVSSTAAALSPYVRPLTVDKQAHSHQAVCKQVQLRTSNNSELLRLRFVVAATTVMWSRCAFLFQHKQEADNLMRLLYFNGLPLRVAVLSPRQVATPMDVSHPQFVIAIAGGLPLTGGFCVGELHSIQSLSCISSRPLFHCTPQAFGYEAASLLLQGRRDMFNFDSNLTGSWMVMIKSIGR